MWVKAPKFLELPPVSIRTYRFSYVQSDQIHLIIPSREEVILRFKMHRNLRSEAPAPTMFVFPYIGSYSMKQSNPILQPEQIR